MRKYLLAALAALALGMSNAHAASSLDCGPSAVDVGAQGGNGVVETAVSGVGGRWVVLHKLANGTVINRGAQYQMWDATVNANSNPQWRGTLYRNPAVKIVGEVGLGVNNVPTYQEWLYNEHGLIMHSLQECRFTDMASAVPPARTAPVDAPAPQTAPAYAPPPVAAAPAAPAPTGEDSVAIVNMGKGALIQITLGTRQAMMLIDTGATEMLVGDKVADQMISNGEAEARGEASFIAADGRKVNSREIVIHRVTIGQHVLQEVPASAVPDDDNVTGLLPFTVLNRVGRFTIDTKNNKLIFG